MDIFNDKDKRFGALPITKDLRNQLRFFRKMDRLKQVWRKTLLHDGSRFENDAEHSWEMATMAIVLASHAPPETDLLKVIQMLLIHDLVEIFAGDTYAYDDVGKLGQRAREVAAADKLYGYLPGEQGSALRALWEEFEARVTKEAKFARAIDRLQPLFHSYTTNGKVWQAQGVTEDKVRSLMTVIGDASPSLGRLADAIINDAVARGILPKNPG